MDKNGTAKSLNQFGNIKEQVYKEKLDILQGQLNLLYEHKHPDYIQGMEMLKTHLKGRLDEIEVFKTLEMERIEKEYKTEQDILKKELEDKKVELMDSLLAELEEKKQQIKHEYQNMDLAGDYVDMKPTSTRKLRRRPNDPLPRDDKRQRKASPAMNFFLTDADVNEDLIALGCPASSLTQKVVEKAGGQSPMQGTPTSSSQERAVISEGDTDSFIDGGKLQFDSKTFLRGQTVYVEASDVGKVTAVIQSIGGTEIGLKSIGENRRIFVNLWELRQGRVVLRKKTG